MKHEGVGASILGHSVPSPPHPLLISFSHPPNRPRVRTSISSRVRRFAAGRVGRWRISESHSYAVNLFYNLYFFGLKFFLNLFLMVSLYISSLSFFPYPQILHFLIFFFLPLTLYEAELEIELSYEDKPVAKEEGVSASLMAEVIFRHSIAKFSCMCVFCLLFLTCIAVQSLK